MPAVSFGEVVREGYGYASVLRAIERLILLRSPTLPNRYQANFEGITRALYDLGTVLSGQIPPPATSTIGPTPGGWDDTTGSYLPGMTPGDGSFWYDSRQGRLFVSFGGEWYQTNGGEAYAAIGPQPPDRQLPGAFWYDTSNDTMMIFLDAASTMGAEGWYPIGGGGTGGGGGGGAASLGTLSDMQVTPIDHGIPAINLAGLVVRDTRVHDGSRGAYKLANRLDLGSY